MNPPNVVSVIGKTYAILTVDSVDSEDSCGEHELQRQEIKIKKDLHAEAARDTLLHELIHAVDEQLDLRLKHRQVHALAAGLLQVLRENPDLVRFLTERQKRR